MSSHRSRPGRPLVVEPAHFTRRHPLVQAVRQACTHSRRSTVGRVGCGQCWEAAIRADATTTSTRPTAPLAIREHVR
jgi:hypothetical protein